MSIKDCLEEFLTTVYYKEKEKSGVSIYNEFSLQFELGYFLRVKGFGVFFEKNIKEFRYEETKNKSIKSEIDLVVKENRNIYAIELKFPNNGQYPESMYSFVKDIKFLEELKDKNYLDIPFDKCFAITVVADPLFRKPSKKTTVKEIYKIFRAENDQNIDIPAIVRKPTGNTDEIVELSQKYATKWEKCENDEELYYYLLEI